MQPQTEHSSTDTLPYECVYREPIRAGHVQNKFTRLTLPQNADL